MTGGWVDEFVTLNWKLTYSYNGIKYIVYMFDCHYKIFYYICKCWLLFMGFMILLSNDAVFNKDFNGLISIERI